LPALNGSALTNLNATALASGTVANARLDAQLQDVAGLATTSGKIIQGDGSNFVLSAYTLPTADGSANQVLTTWFWCSYFCNTNSWRYNFCCSRLWFNRWWNIR
jgi:hypothetical protein